MFAAFRLNRIIKKAIKQTVSEVEGKYPEIIFHTFYGSVDISPRNLTVWYIFKSDSDLAAARESGFCDKIKEMTVDKLVSSGYPEEAFVPDEKGKTAAVCFASQEDVERKADGDYRLYFQ